MTRANGRCASRLLLLVGIVAVCFGIMQNGAVANNALGVPDAEYNALVALYNSTGGDNWRDNSNWLSENTPWHGVMVEDGHVTSIELADNNMVGQLPAELADLSNLYSLALMGNQLSGPIPAWLGNLGNLHGLYLYYNQLSGSIPPELGNLTNLVSLYLSGNQLTGQIPRELGKLTNLQKLSLDGNQLVGPVPSELGDLVSVQELYLSNNQLTGQIPAQFGNLTNMQFLGLSANQLSGPIPAALGNLTQLRILSLDGNQFVCAVPPWIANLSQLTYLNLGYNGFSCSDPDMLSFLAAADSDWQDTQTVPPADVSALIIPSGDVIVRWSPNVPSYYNGYYEVGYSQNPGGPYTFDPANITNDNMASSVVIHGLDVSNPVYFVVRTVTMAGAWNQSILTSVLSPEVQGEQTISNGIGVSTDEFNALVALYNNCGGMHWSNNSGWLTEQTDWYGVTVEDGHVKSINLPSNGLNGQIPAELGSLSNLQSLYIFGNRLNGSIPAALGNMSSLQYLDLANNLLSGSIPAEVGNLSSLLELGLDYNELTGPIPSELGNMSSLQCMNLACNKLDGPIPSQLSNLSNLQWLYLFDDYLSGPIPAELGSLSNLQFLNLEGNQLSGPIPAELGNLSGLQGLDLSYNQLTGSIPATLGNLSELSWLEVGNNALTGPIPQELANLSSLQVLWLQGNQFIEEVPSWMATMPQLAYLDLGYNGFSCSDPALLSYLANVDSGWQYTQTVPPTNVSAAIFSTGNVKVSWTPIAYSSYNGYYEAGYSSTPGGPYVFDHANRTNDKQSACVVVHGLDISNPVYFVVRTVTMPNWANQSTLTSVISNEVQGAPTTANTLGVSWDEYNALVALYNSTNGDEWNSRNNWLTETTPWYGVTVADGHVTSIDLSDNQLAGQIPPELGNLTELQWLGLHNNRLTGQIPPELGNLANLQYLRLGNNQLTGPIPSELANLSNLQYLYLSSNQFIGEVPTWISNLTQLSYLELNYNGFTCSDPDVLSLLEAVAPYWHDTQTVPPTDVLAPIVSSSDVVVRWTPINYYWYDGYYEVGYSSTPGGPYTFDPANRTNSKSASSLAVHGLDLSKPVYFVVRTISSAAGWVNQSTLTSVLSTEVAAAPAVNNLGISDSEFDALVELYASTNGCDWSDSTNWLTTNTPWYGVTVEGGHVTHILLEQNNLVGQMPASLGSLTDLHSMGLSFNGLSGQIPAELSNLSNLKVLNLTNNQLTGEIPLELGNLASLQQLFLDSNQLGGAIPAELGNLTNLQTLSLAYDQLTGPIPHELGRLTDLTGLDLCNNQLTGSVPTELGDLTNLESLSLAHNQLTGSIPPALGNLTNLQWLFLDDNQLTGSIPAELGNLPNLLHLWLYQNHLTGQIPAELGQCSNLLFLQLDHNQLAGPIPPALGNLSNLGYLSLASNQFMGEVPAWITNLTQLGILYLDDNGFTSSDPNVLQFLAAVNPYWQESQTVAPTDVSASIFSTGNVVVRWTPILYVWYEGYYEVGYSSTPGGPYTFDPANRTSDKWASHLVVHGLDLSSPVYFAVRTVSLPGWRNQSTLTSQPSEEAPGVPTSGNALGVSQAEYDTLAALYNSTNGDGWNNKTNWLTDDTPWYGVTVDNGQVTSLDLQYNNLAGQLPAELGSLANLHHLQLYCNRLTGPIPAELGNLANLLDLNIFGNHMTSQIPPELGSLANLQNLFLGRNELSGPIPANLENLANLQSLDLGENQLTGQIPSELGSLGRLLSLNLRLNQLSGAIPPELGSLANLQLLSLSYNQLTGTIPAALGSLGAVQILDLGNNQLAGPIPPELGNMTGLQNLYLAGNQFMGEVPSWITGFPHLWYIDLQFNGLSSSNPDVLSYLEQVAYAWSDTQTVPPTDVRAAISSAGGVTVSWTPVTYSPYDDWCYATYYEVGYSSAPGGPYTFDPANRVYGAMVTSTIIHGLDVSRPIYFVVRTGSQAGWWNQSELVSGLSNEAVLPPSATNKLAADGSTVLLQDFAVTAEFDGYFYVEKSDRSWGIRVEGDSHNLGRVNVLGTLHTNEDGERFIQPSFVEPVGGGDPPPPLPYSSAAALPVTPLYLPNRSLGGGNWCYESNNGMGQCGIDGGVGLNNIGLLVKTTGKVVLAGRDWLYIDDGSGVDDGSGIKGLYVDAKGYPNTPNGATVWITGISSCDFYHGRIVNTLRAIDGGIISSQGNGGGPRSSGAATEAVNPREH